MHIYNPGALTRLEGSRARRAARTRPLSPGDHRTLRNFAARSFSLLEAPAPSVACRSLTLPISIRPRWSGRQPAGCRTLNSPDS